MGTDSSGRHVHEGGAVGAIARPVHLLPAALLLGFVVDHLVPLPFPIPRTGPAHAIGAIVAGAAILAGVALFAAGARNFSRAATPLPTNRPARVLVTTGIHGRTRNPIYLGFLLMYVGVGLAVRSPWVLALALPTAATIRYGVVAREEAYLDRRFGDAYREYSARVRRWV